ncbi:uncharacterized protein [Primulina eburnea]|uniref:uncharacterized protein n=1 Tax=Primulina eburnea TaxID=1245227 RepID=UPI003C6CA462
MVKPGSGVPEKIRESTRFYSYFKDCIGAIDGTHIPAIVFEHDTNSYSNRHGTISQNVLAACNFDLEFIYVISGWEGSAHDSNILADALSRNNGLKSATRIFGIFKSRFKIFKTAHPFPYTTQAELVLACAGLHNFLRKECRSDEFPVEPENEVPQPSSEQVYGDNNFDQIFGTEEQQRANANAWRDIIANRMWSDVDHIHKNKS